VTRPYPNSEHKTGKNLPTKFPEEPKKNKKNDGGERKNEKEVCFLFFGYDISSCSQLAFLPVSTAYF